MEGLTLSPVSEAIEEILMARELGVRGRNLRKIATQRAAKMREAARKNKAATQSAAKKRRRKLEALGIHVLRFHDIQKIEVSLK